MSSTTATNAIPNTYNDTTSTQNERINVSAHDPTQFQNGTVPGYLGSGSIPTPRIRAQFRVTPVPTSDTGPFPPQFRVSPQFRARIWGKWEVLCGCER